MGVDMFVCKRCMMVWGKQWWPTPTCHSEHTTDDGADPDQEVEEVARVTDSHVDGRKVEDEKYGRHLHAALGDPTPILCDAELVRVHPAACNNQAS